MPLKRLERTRLAYQRMIHEEEDALGLLRGTPGDPLFCRVCGNEQPTETYDGWHVRCGRCQSALTPVTDIQGVPV